MENQTTPILYDQFVEHMSVELGEVLEEAQAEIKGGGISIR